MLQGKATQKVATQLVKQGAEVAGAAADGEALALPAANVIAEEWATSHLPAMEAAARDARVPVRRIRADGDLK